MKVTHIGLILCLCFVLGIFNSCKQSTSKSGEASTAETKAIVDESNTTSERALPTWARNANIYEVNIRQYSKEGTFAALTADLPRLKDMGVDILWLMPIFPISTAKRKGGLGSYYAVSDFRETNPEFGTKEDFKALMAAAHQKDMYIILDWVPNHTGWDHVWLTDHKDWFTQNEKGEVVDPIDPSTGKSWGWTDVADLNFDQPDMRKTMIADMAYWITDMDIDGFRMDVAHGVPDNFWDEVATALYPLKSIFMLAESETPYHTNSTDFHATYGWSFHHLMNDIAKGKHNAADIDKYLAKDAKEFKGGFHMHFTSNHDENSWGGTVFERMGDGHKTFAVLAATLDGMPLIYCGQEAPLRKRLEFFEKDAINWNGYAYTDFYKKLLALKKNNQALWNGEFGGKAQKITTNKEAEVYAYMREKNGDKVVVILNLSDQTQQVILQGDAYVGNYMDLFNERSTLLEENMEMSLNPWDYVVLSSK